MNCRNLLLAALALASAGCGERQSTEPLAAMGLRHSCALAADGTAYCWGVNNTGQLGDSTTVDRTTPAPVHAAARFVQLTGGRFHTCGITAEGEAYCWGWNNRGQLGDGSAAVFRTVPTRVAGNHTFKDISSGGLHTCAVTLGGRVLCWGDNEFGQLGDGSRMRPDSTWAEQRAPRAVHGALDFIQITAGGAHSCGVTGSAQVLCWGSNQHGQLGIGRSGERVNRPTPVQTSKPLVEVSAGLLHTCGKTVLGGLYCWGNNWYGQLGSYTRGANVPIPAADSLASYRTVRAIGNRTCAITSAARLMCWGHNPDRSLGVAFPDSAPDRVPSARPVITGDAVFASLGSGISNHICGTTTEGAVMCWGANESGQIDGSGETRTRPVLIPLSEE